MSVVSFCFLLDDTEMQLGKLLAGKL